MRKASRQNMDKRANQTFELGTPSFFHAMPVETYGLASRLSTHFAWRSLQNDSRGWQLGLRTFLAIMHGTSARRLARQLRR